MIYSQQEIDKIDKTDRQKGGDLVRVLHKGSYVWGVLKFSINGGRSEGLADVPRMRT